MPVSLPPTPVLDLLRRATYGPRAGSVAELRRLGATAWLDRQLRPSTLTDPIVERLWLRWHGARLDRPAGGGAGAPGRRPLAADVRHVARAVWSTRQLYELTVDF